jgi:hypothetical protein
VYWVANELATAKVELANPTAFDIELQSIALRYPLSLYLHHTLCTYITSLLLHQLSSHTQLSPHLYRCSTQGVAFEAYYVSCVIPAKCTSYELLLSGKLHALHTAEEISGKPLESGTLTIRGCHIKCFNLQCEHPINAMGMGISL